MRSNDKIDANDLAHVKRLGLDPVKALPCPFGGKGFINPHVSRFFLKDGSHADVFHVKPVYYETKDGSWRPLSEIAVHHGNRTIVLNWADAWTKASTRFLIWLAKRQRLLGRELSYAIRHGFYSGVDPHEAILADTTTFYPDPNPETTTVDGDIKSTLELAWATARNESTGLTLTDSDARVRTIGKADGGPFYTIFRGFFLFDTTIISASGGGVSSATLSLYSATGDIVNTDNDGDDWVNVFSSSPASNIALATSDYGSVGSTEFSTRLDITSAALDAYNDFAFNASGIAAISTSGVSKFSTREGHDFINSAMATSTDNDYLVKSADQSGTTQDPKLVVVAPIEMPYTLVKGDLTLTGKANAMTFPLSIVKGDLTLSGKTGTIAYAMRGAKGDLTLTGEALQLAIGLSVVKGDLVLSGKSAKLGNVFAVVKGDLSLVGYTAALVTSTLRDLTVYLMEGSTIIAFWTHSNIGTSFVQADQTLTSEQAAQVTAPHDLRLRFEADSE